VAADVRSGSSAHAELTAAWIAMSAKAATIARENDVDTYDEGAEDTRQEFTANDFRIRRLLDSMVATARGIRSDNLAAGDMTSRINALRHLLKQVGHEM
jgi:hypothetical protein